MAEPTKKGEILSSNFKDRLITASFLISALILVLLFGDVIGVQVVVLIVAGVSFYEYFNMAFKDESYLYYKWVGTALGMLLMFIVVSGYEQYLFHVTTFVILVLFFFYLYFARQNHIELVKELALSFFGIFYVCVLLSYFVFIRRFPEGHKWIILVLGISWLSDTGGYWCGKVFGTRKLMPVISPHKTVEGAFGSVAFAVVASIFISYFLLRDRMTLSSAIFLGGVGSLCAQLGDLCESLLKRNFSVKDSGNVIPGHGGMLDCIDSVLFVAPLVYLYNKVFLTISSL